MPLGLRIGLPVPGPGVQAAGEARPDREMGHTMNAIGMSTGLDSPTEPLASMRPRLDRIAALGFTHAEISAKSLGVVINGELYADRLSSLQHALAGCPLELTLHGSEIASGLGGNLMDITTASQRSAVAADIALAAAIGATVVVYHSGMLRDPGGDADSVAAGLVAERIALAELGDVAGEAGITIAVENRDPVGRYVLRNAYGLDLDRLAAQIEAVNHPYVGVCLDVGHAFLACAYLGHDYLPAIERIAPLTSHIHLSDNFGKVQLDETADPAENLIHGLGDLHLPPGWGAIPLESVFRIDFPREPIVLLELNPRFDAHLPEILATIRQLIRQPAPVIAGVC